ncbi:DUF3516 domain-containing protein, partial [Myxococcota bacterium]|nr:DUF3516 domain-containing protein [Myxococcota bacterium]
MNQSKIKIESRLKELPATEGRLVSWVEKVRGQDDDTVLEAFFEAMIEREIELYPAQEDAMMEAYSLQHVILNTPTGSGKTLVALALQFKALAQGKTAWYTSPIKALVSEKFFALCDEFGAENVGMVTGDATINAEAPIICCTAEILSNQALRVGAATDIDYAILDEYHYYADRERGMAWQVPILIMKNTQFLLMSATLGNVKKIEDSLKELSGRDVSVVRGTERPVPLELSYSTDPLHETISTLVQQDRAPIYLVNFTQRAASENAQNLLSVDYCTKEEKREIADALKGFRFDTPFGKDISRLIRHGVGLHHAGLLPKYRLLVEQLAQKGLLKIISGTDTLGVGVNIPLRTVLFTGLAKYDGEKTGILKVRDFKQISGRAGRKGFDSVGYVVCQAPEHIIENLRLAAKAAAKGKKSKFVKKKPPTKNYVAWDQNTFNRLKDQEPEELRSSFTINHGVLMTIMQGHTDTRSAGYKELLSLIERSHESAVSKKKLKRLSAQLFRSLRDAAIISIVKNPDSGARVVINEDLQKDFSLHYTLSLYLLSTMGKLSEQSENFGMDALSLTEAIMENPRAVLFKILDRARDERYAELKSEGVEYDQLREELDKVDYPKPNAGFIYDTFNTFSGLHPWVGHENIRPKSIARDMYERFLSFEEYTRDLGLQRSEGVLLRYLSQVYKALTQII